MACTNNRGELWSFYAIIVIVLESILIINGDFGNPSPFGHSVESEELCRKFSRQNISQKIVLIGIYDGTKLMIIDKHLSIFYFSLNDPNQAKLYGYQKFYPELLDKLQFRDTFLDNSNAEYKFQPIQAYISRCNDELAITFMKIGQNLIHHMSFKPIGNIIETLDITLADTIYNNQPDTLILLSNFPGVSKNNIYWIKQRKTDNTVYLVRAEYGQNDITCRYPVKNQSRFYSYPFCFKSEGKCVQAFKAPILKGFFGPNYIYVMDDRFLYYVKISEITRKESTFTMHTLLVNNFFKCDPSDVTKIVSYIENIPENTFIVTIIMIFGIIIVCYLIACCTNKQATPQQPTSPMVHNHPKSPAYGRERMWSWIPGNTSSYRPNWIKPSRLWKSMVSGFRSPRLPESSMLRNLMRRRRRPLSRSNISSHSYSSPNYGRSLRRSALSPRRKIGRYYRSSASSHESYHHR